MGRLTSIATAGCLYIAVLGWCEASARTVVEVPQVDIRVDRSSGVPQVESRAILGGDRSDVSICTAPFVDWLIYTGARIELSISVPFEQADEYRRWFATRSVVTFGDETNADLLTSVLDRTDQILRAISPADTLARARVIWVMAPQDCRIVVKHRSRLPHLMPTTIAVPVRGLLPAREWLYSQYLVLLAQTVSHEFTHLLQIALSQAYGPADPRCRDFSLCFDRRKLVQAEFEAVAVETCVNRAVFARDRHGRGKDFERVSRLKRKTDAWQRIVSEAERTYADSSIIIDLVALFSDALIHHRRKSAATLTDSELQRMLRYCAQFAQSGAALDNGALAVDESESTLPLVKTDGLAPALRFRGTQYD